MSPSAPDRCWILSDGKPGTESQCLGLAHALGLEPVWKRLVLRGIYRHLQPRWRWGQAWALDPASDPIQPPWPKVMITGGRQAVATAVWIKRRARAQTYSIMVQDPRISARHFDLIICPEHDRRKGPRILTTCGSLHRLRPADLEAARRHWPALGALPGPRLVVLVGGTGGGYRLDPSTTGMLADQLRGVQRRLGGAILLSTSRRTGADNVAILHARLRDIPGVVVTPAEPPTQPAVDPAADRAQPPLAALLAWADAVLVTADSVTMISEAALTGRPLYLVALPGGAEKFQQFHQSLARRGIARPFEGEIALDWGQTLDETSRIAAEVRARAGDWLG